MVNLLGEDTKFQPYKKGIGNSKRISIYLIQYIGCRDIN